MRIEPPSFNDDLSDDVLSEATNNEKPLGMEEFKQRVENNRKNEKKYGKPKPPK